MLYLIIIRMNLTRRLYIWYKKGVITPVGGRQPASELQGWFVHKQPTHGGQMSTAHFYNPQQFEEAPPIPTHNPQECQIIPIRKADNGQKTVLDALQNSDYEKLLPLLNPESQRMFWEHKFVIRSRTEKRLKKIQDEYEEGCLATWYQFHAISAITAEKRLEIMEEALRNYKNGGSFQEFHTTRQFSRQVEKEICETNLNICHKRLAKMRVWREGMVAKTKAEYDSRIRELWTALYRVPKNRACAC